MEVAKKTNGHLNAGNHMWLDANSLNVYLYHRYSALSKNNLGWFFV